MAQNQPTNDYAHGEQCLRHKGVHETVASYVVIDRGMSNVLLMDRTIILRPRVGSTDQANTAMQSSSVRIAAGRCTEIYYVVDPSTSKEHSMGTSR